MPGPEELVLLTKDINHAKTVSLQFDMMVEAYGGGGMAPAFVVNIQFGQLGYDLLVVSPTSLAFVETLKGVDGGSDMITSHPIGGGFPTGIWTHVAVVLNLPQVAMPGNAAITLGNQPALQTPLTYAIPVSTGGTVSFGLIVTSAPMIWKIRYDNVLIDKSG